MDASKAIIELLGVQDVEVESIELRSKSGRAEIELRYRGSEGARCPTCGWKLGRIHSWQRCRLQGPPLGIFTHVLLTVFFPRAYCFGCRQNRSPKISWRHPHCPSMTCGFAEVAGRLMEETTCEAAARLLRANSRTFWSLDQFRMRVLAQRVRFPESLDLSYLSADEVHFRTYFVGKERGIFKRWEPQFITNLVSYYDGKVLSNSLGRGADSLQKTLSVLTPEQKLSVKKFGLDMHDGFIAAAKYHCPNAEVCIDRFHLVQNLNKAFDEVRREEFKKARQNKILFLEGMLSPGRKFVLMERNRSRSALENKMLERLRNLNDRIHSSMLLVESFHAVLDKFELPKFRQALLDWYLLARESRLKSFRRFAHTVIKYRRYIEAYIVSRLTTAVSEGINNKIKTLKRMAYGYANPESFKNKILQRCGYLNHYCINTNDLFHSCPNAP